MDVTGIQSALSIQAPGCTAVFWDSLKDSFSIQIGPSQLLEFFYLFLYLFFPGQHQSINKLLCVKCIYKMAILLSLVVKSLININILIRVFSTDNDLNHCRNHLTVQMWIIPIIMYQLISYMEVVKWYHYDTDDIISNNHQFMFILNMNLQEKTLITTYEI